MARLQSVVQQHFLERSASPLANRMVTGMSGSSIGMPRLSSSPTAKAASALLKIKSPRLGSLKIKGPRLGGLKIQSPKLPSLKLKMPRL